MLSHWATGFQFSPALATKTKCCRYYREEVGHGGSDALQNVYKYLLDQHAYKYLLDQQCLERSAPKEPLVCRIMTEYNYEPVQNNKHTN